MAYQLSMSALRIRGFALCLAGTVAATVFAAACALRVPPPPTPPETPPIADVTVDLEAAWTTHPWLFGRAIGWCFGPRASFARRPDRNCRDQTGLGHRSTELERVGSLVALGTARRSTLARVPT